MIDEYQPVLITEDALEEYVVKHYGKERPTVWRVVSRYKTGATDELVVVLAPQTASAQAQARQRTYLRACTAATES